VTCAENCAVDGADYPGTYGVTASGDSLQIDFVTTSSQKNVGARLYLMADNTHYEMFHLLNQEFTFDVDVSHLPCGLNGALYMSAMPADGGVSTQPNNKAGAQYGVGYCDSQCPRDLKWIGGEVSLISFLARIFLTFATPGKCCGLGAFFEQREYWTWQQWSLLRGDGHLGGKLDFYCSHSTFLRHGDFDCVSDLITISYPGFVIEQLLTFRCSIGAMVMHAAELTRRIDMLVLAIQMVVISIRIVWEILLSMVPG
jgi:hypothetical protein